MYFYIKMQWQQHLRNELDRGVEEQLTIETIIL